MNTSFSPLDSLLRQLSSHAFMDETACVEKLLPHIEPFKAVEPLILSRAIGYVEALRTEKSQAGMEAFLQEYGLATKEGVGILHLAEALLRIPDAETADLLIEEVIEGTTWRKPEGQHSNRLMGGVGFGMSLAQKLLHWGGEGSLIGKLGDPLVRASLSQALRIMGGLFIMGETMPKAMRQATSYARKGYLFSYDMLGEAARTASQAEAYTKRYLDAIQVIGSKTAPAMPLHQRPGISVKLSALHPRFELLKFNRMTDELLGKVLHIARTAKEQKVMVTIDAEESYRLDITLAVFSAALADESLQGFDGFGIAVQAYQKRALYVLEFLQKLAAQTGCRIPVRLVKGAYWDTEIKRSQVLGLEGFPVFTRKEHTDVSYLACVSYLLQYPENFYPQFATHNALTVAAILQVAGDKGYEFQRLHGMGEQLYGYVLEQKGVQCRIYAPVGPHEELLAYLIRRLLENGASTSFIHRLTDRSLSVEAVLVDPVKETLLHAMHPSPDIASPAGLYGNERKNSQGVDSGCRHQMFSLHSQLRSMQESIWIAAPLINGEAQKGQPVRVYQPSDQQKQLGEVVPATTEQVKQAMEAADKGFSSWSVTPVERRAEILEKLADILEENTVELIALCMREGGKTVGDSMGEIREAADYCRYYAAEARRLLGARILMGPVGEENSLGLYPRGVFVAISPWNFPLAIFVGQIVAALVTGNTVVAKPAGQTPLIAYRTVIMMHEAGVPVDAVHLLPGAGSVIGAALVQDAMVSGVVFTGSTEVARSINRSLAARNAKIVPLIAETGGQNCMIVDSSSLLEQAVDEIITSAFNSAGQRCSALRVLYVQEEIADKLINLLTGAMAELQIGEPTHFATDIGPVIDKNALQGLQVYCEKMKKKSIHYYSPALDNDLLQKGWFIAPHLIEIPSIHSLQGEMFGPILHVIRYRRDKLHQVIEEINSTGYGLTLGIFSRIESRVRAIASRVKVGNIYVNRSMIGAVVGVQPFGGEGLSGTGPKAGGPHYLERFCTERTMSVNTAAIGGNIGLLA